MKASVTKYEFDETIKRLSGELFSLRNQVTEVNKRLNKGGGESGDVSPRTPRVTPRDMAALWNDLNAHSATHDEFQRSVKPLLHKLSEEVERLKLERSMDRSAAEFHEFHEALRRLSEEHALMQAQVAALQQSNAGWVQAVLASLQEMQRKLQQAVAVESALMTLQGSFQQLQQTSQQTNIALQQLQASSRQAATEIQRLQSESSQFKQEILKMVEGETSRARDAMAKEQSAMEEEARRAKQFAERLSRKERDIDQEIQRMKQSVSLEMRNQLKALEGTRRDLLSKQSELLRQSKTQSRDQSNTLELQKLMVLETEFYELRQTLNNLGVLKPKVEEKLGKPVGTIALADDCFSARVLTKFMYIKARTQKERELKLLRGLECWSSCELDLISSESDYATSYDSDALALLSQCCDNVAGLPDLVIEEGAPGYWQVTSLWTAVCIFTLAIQIIIVAVLVKYSQKPTECFNRQPTEQEWLVLHGSKALAVMVAGALMAKDYMDLVNDTLVSILIESRLAWETGLLNCCRFSLITLIGIANIMLFEGMVSPVSVWINMAALAFVGELSAAVAEQGKKGVFGHHIREQLTNLNFELTFVSDHPWWIPIVQACTVLFVAIFVVVGAYIAARAPDAMCKA